MGPGNRALLDWYRPRTREYPWRRSLHPYRVLVSEVMLQQTQASRVIPAYGRFLRRFPSVGALAAAPRDEVVRAWAGLGYNRRAVALSDAARAMVRDHGGRVPSDGTALVRLPGVGPYTAAAVAAVAFGVPAAAIDTNVARVVARARLGVDVADAEPARVRKADEAWLYRPDPGAWNQALMDLGRLVCRARPRCHECPLSSRCRFRLAGAPPGPPRRRQGPFAGTSRQLRGAAVKALVRRSPRTVGGLAGLLGFPVPQLAEALRGLHRDGIVRAGPAALEGSPRGWVRI
jgi:A/G-specific adenine glycosylase